MEKKTNKRKHPMYSSFSKTLLYNQDTTSKVISVRNYPDGEMTATEHAMSSVTLADFYDSANNDAFLTYSRTLISDAKGRIGCALIFGSKTGETELKIMRDSLGKLMEVLFVFHFTGIPISPDAESETVKSGEGMTLARMLAYYRLCLDGDLGDDAIEWEYLNSEITKFANFLTSVPDLNKISDYILDRLCLCMEEPEVKNS